MRPSIGFDPNGISGPDPGFGWRNASFQGYADYTATAEFAEGLAELLKLTASKRTALMCAEAVWRRCHRSIIADVLKLRGIEVIHIIDATHTTAHPYTSPARVVDGRLSYATPQRGCSVSDRSSMSHIDPLLPVANPTCDDTLDAGMT